MNKYICKMFYREIKNEGAKYRRGPQVDSFFPSPWGSPETKESVHFVCKTEKRSAINRKQGVGSDSSRRA